MSSLNFNPFNNTVRFATSSLANFKVKFNTKVEGTDKVKITRSDNAVDDLKNATQPFTYTATISGKRSKGVPKLGFGIIDDSTKQYIWREIHSYGTSDDYTIQCPQIDYSSDMKKMNIITYPNIAVLKHIILQVKKTGSNATWTLYSLNLIGNGKIYNNLDIPENASQMKFVVHNEKGNTRNCYTIPLKMEQAKVDYQNEIVYNHNIKCPTVTETTNPQGLAPIYQDNVKTIHSGFTDLKLKNSLEGADKTHYSKYQYNWFMKINSDKSIWDNKGVTFNYSKVEQFNTNFYGEFPSGTRGMLILIDKNGNIKSCYTDYYDNYVYDSMKQINGINYFLRKELLEKIELLKWQKKYLKCLQ